jgi:hypothetical protein
VNLAHELLALLAEGRPLAHAAAAIERSLLLRLPGRLVRLESGPGAGPSEGGPGGEVRVAAVLDGRTVGYVVVSPPPVHPGGDDEAAALQEHAGLWALCLGAVGRRREPFEWAVRREAAAAAALHDEALQHVVAIDLGLQRLRDRLPAPVLDELRDRCGEAVAELRRLAGSLEPLARPGTGLDLGALAEAVVVRRLGAAGVPAVVRGVPGGPGPALDDSEARVLAHVVAELADRLLEAGVTAVVLEAGHDHLGPCLRVEAARPSGGPVVVPDTVRWLVGALGGELRTAGGAPGEGDPATGPAAVRKDSWKLEVRIPSAG